MGVEKLFFNRNVTTAIPVGQARGIVCPDGPQRTTVRVRRAHADADQAGCHGLGGKAATRTILLSMVTKILHLPEPPKPDDTADALAIAICTTHCMESITEAADSQKQSW